MQKASYLRNNNNGYTLIEVVLVMVIISVAFTGIYSVFTSNLKHDTESRYEMIASNLAQEGIEIVRNERDNEMMQASPDFTVWENALTNNNIVPRVNNNGSVTFLTNATLNSQREVCTDGVDTHYYTQTGSSCATGTPFRRWISVSDGATSDDGEIEIVCTVEWDSFAASGVTRSVEARTLLTDWDQ